MGKKRKETLELRYYDIPQGHTVVPRLGSDWDRIYGDEGVNYHFHNLMEIGICRRGPGELWFDGECCPYDTGMVSVIPENYPHVTISGGGLPNYWEYLFISPRNLVEELFPGNPLNQREILELVNRGPLLLPQEERPGLFRTVDEIMEEARNPKRYTHKMIRELAKVLIIEILRQNSRLGSDASWQRRNENMAQIAAALDYIDQNYVSPIKAQTLAGVCNMSETHFRRTFEDYMNMLPMDYVNLIRVQRACELMIKTNDSMDDVAAKCGFATTSTFCRNFKKFLNTSPYQWKINPNNFERKLMNYNISAKEGW